MLVIQNGYIRNILPRPLPKDPLPPWSQGASCKHLFTINNDLETQNVEPINKSTLQLFYHPAPERGEIPGRRVWGTYEASSPTLKPVGDSAPTTESKSLWIFLKNWSEVILNFALFLFYTFKNFTLGIPLLPRIKPKVLIYRLNNPVKAWHFFYYKTRLGRYECSLSMLCFKIA